MALPVNPVNSLQWTRYNSTDNLVAQFALDFGSYSAYTFQPTGTVLGQAAQSAQGSADGMVIDNTGNQNAVTITVGGKYVESVPAFVKAQLLLGGNPPSVVVSSLGGACYCTFYKGDYPGDTAHTNVLGANKAGILAVLPPGVGPIPWGGSVGTIPDGWIYCNGAAVSRVTYQNLFNAIGTRYGAGDGSSTFNLPDMRGKFVRGFDDGAGVDTGRVLGSTQGWTMAGHWHAMQNHYHAMANHYHRTAVGWNNGAVQFATSGGGPQYGNDNLVLSQNTIQFTSSGSGNNYFARTDTTAYLANDGTQNATQTLVNDGTAKANLQLLNDGSEVRPVNIALVYMIKT